MFTRNNQLAVVLGVTMCVGLGIQTVHAHDNDRFEINDRFGNNERPGRNKTPKNVILFIGDGMGISEVTLTRYYQYGVKGRMNLDKLKYTGFQTTWSLKPGAGPDYASDYTPASASTGTMWATGRKTIDERISQGPSTALNVPGKNYQTILEVFKAQGKRVGNVTTAEITDATPAVLDSHISLRSCQAPKNMTSCPTERKAVGGPGSIAEQTVDHRVDVLLGGGKGRFDGTGGLIEGGPAGPSWIPRSARATRSSLPRANSTLCRGAIFRSSACSLLAI